MPEPLGESSFSKGIGLLGWLLDHENARADEMAAGTGLPLSTTYRFLRVLRERGFVMDVDGRFRPGPRLRDVRGVMPADRLADLATPFLQYLSQVSEESAVLTVRHGLHGVCVRQVESEHQLRLVLRVGQLLPLYAGASQRVLLAFAPEHVQHAVQTSDFRLFTPNTPTRNELRGILARVRNDRLAISKGELMSGSVSLAAPVFRGSEVLCAIGVAGPQKRCGSAWQSRVRDELARSAESLVEVLAGPD